METLIGIVEEAFTPEVIAVASAAGVAIAGALWAVVRKRLRAKAAQTETPVDDMILDVVDTVLQKRK